MAKKIDLKNLWSKYKKRINLIFGLLLLVLLIMEIFVIKSSVSIGLSAKSGPAPVVGGSDSKVRVDFPTYNSDLDRIQNGGNFIPDISTTTDPFSRPGQQQ